ncbi:hypothetical protein VTJ04DRAFT_2079 [Mycothermus thermophilus]|uniref:uncharacterized protein n=1 Tax=Humicola insolens TaxID=85995 RepID=UPI0037429B97
MMFCPDMLAGWMDGITHLAEMLRGSAPCLSAFVSFHLLSILLFLNSHVVRDTPIVDVIPFSRCQWTC